MDEKTIARFWSKVDRNGPIQQHCPELGPCWVWVAGKHGAGYGVMGIGQKVVLSHRLSWGLHNGSIAHDLCVLHRCDNRSCVNPAHLFTGTRMDNTRDMMRKKRDNREAKVKRGSDHGNARLTESQVLEIRQRLSTGDTWDTIASDFGVSKSTIGYVSTVGWSHV